MVGDIWDFGSLSPRPTYTGEIKDIDTDFLHLLDCNVQVAVVCGGHLVVGHVLL